MKLRALTLLALSFPALGAGWGCSSSSTGADLYGAGGPAGADAGPAAVDTDSSGNAGNGGGDPGDAASATPDSPTAADTDPPQDGGALDATVPDDAGTPDGDVSSDAPDDAVLDATPDVSVDAGNCHAATNTCDTAVEVITIDGDTGSPSRTLFGARSKWYKIRINEGDNTSQALSYTVTLTTPSGTAWELYVQEGTDTDPDCDATPLDGTGNPLSVSDAWDDTLGSEDSRWLSIEIRYVSGTSCGNWTLKVEGHT